MTVIVSRRLGTSRDDWHAVGPEDLYFGDTYLPTGWSRQRRTAISYTYSLAIGYRAKWSGASSVREKQK